MRAQIKDISGITYDGDSVAFTVVLDAWYRQDVYETVDAIATSDKPFIMTVEKQKRQRSLNANAYCWILCHKIAEKVGATKEAVYRKNIMEVGSFDVVEIAETALKKWIANWSSRGLGWIAEPLGKSDKEGYVNVINYYGSSTYDTQEMARLVDALVQEARTLGIETMTPAELSMIKTSWKGG